MKKLFEKTILEKWILSFLLIGIFSFLFTSDLQATHFRYGSVTWEPVQGQANTIKFTVRAAWRRDFGGFPSNVSVGQTVNTSNGSNANFRFGGNTNLGLDEPMIAIVTAVNVAENWIQTEWIKTVTYSSGPGDYTAYFQSCCRINELQNNTTNNPPNNGGSNQLNYRVETIVNVGSGNRPPTTTLPTIINLQTNQNTADIQVPGVDPDGDNIAFRLATASEATYGGGLGFGGSGNPNNNPYGPPAGLSISSTGLISFNTVGKAIGELYSISVVLEDDEVGALGISKTMVDVLVRIVGESLPPEFDYTVTPANGSLIKVAPGDNVNFTVKATDPDPTNLFGESDVSIQAAGAPGAGSFTPPLPTTPADPTTTTFDWTPVSGTADLGTYVLSFFAEDGLGVQTVTNVTIVVTLAPVFTQASGQALPECLTEGDVLSRTIEASDLDPSDQVSIISIGVQNPPSTFAAGFPVQTTVSPNILTSIPTTVGNPTTTQLDWTVAASDWGIYELVFTAEDSYLDQTELEHYYIVDAAPQFTSSPVVNAFENQVYSYTVTATDPDVVASLGDAIFIDPTKSTIPSWLTLVDNGDGTAVLSGTPTNAEVGPHVVSIELHDKTTHYRHTHCTQDFQNFTITVNPCNITLTASIVDEDCPGANDGSIDLSVAGATGATTYAWSNGDNMEDISGLAPNNYTVMVTDNVGCVQSASFTINAGIDSSPPSISCPSDMAVYNTPGSCDAIVNFTVSGTDNCGTPTIVSTPASGSVFSLGTTTVTSTSTDGSGNVASCSFTVTVVDDEDPTISCSPEIIVSNDPGQCGAKVTYNITSSDNCGMGPIAGFQYLGVFGNNSYYISQGVFTWTQAKADAEANGGHLATITDANENNFIAPFLAGRQPWIGLVDLLQEGVYQWITGETFGYSNWGPGEPNNQGNEDYGHFRADGLWNDLPNAGPGFNPTQYVLEIEGVTVNQTGGIASGETFPIGTTLVAYQATDAAGNTASCSFNVTVNDTEAPGINCPSNMIVSNDVNDCSAVVNFSVTGSDNCPNYSITSTPASGSVFQLGTTTVNSIITDASGNTTPCSFDITVNDNEPPVVNCQNIIVFLNTSGTASIAHDAVDGGSTDNCGIASYVTDKTNFSCADLGINVVNLQVTDIHGNSNNCPANVTVIDNISPVITCPADATRLTDSGVCDYTAGGGEFDPTATDNCNQTTNINNYNGGSTLDGASFNIGTTTVTWTTTDASGNMDVCSFDITVNDTELPSIMCPSHMTVFNDVNDCGAVVNFSVTGSDNCPNYSITSTPASGSVFPVGINTVNSIITDASGNTESCSFTITVIDNEPPDVMCKNIDVYLSATGTASITHDAVDNGSTDNCGIASYITDETNFTCANLGLYVVNLQVTDIHGNSNNCPANVTVIDNISPVITCPADATRLTDSGVCDYTAGGGEFDPTATDNCNQTTNINNYNGGSTLDGASFDIGTTTVTWTTTDASGNMDVCSFDITVNKAADPTLLFAYTMIARKEVHVHESDVQSGGVGVWESGKKAKVHHESNVTSFVKAPIIDQDNNSTIGTSIIGEALVPLPVFRINTMSSNLDLKVEDNQMHTINPGDPIAYDKIEVKKNATLIVNVPELYGKEIKTKDGATISFGQTTEVMLEKKFDLDKNNTFNSTGEAVYVYTEKQMDVKEGGNVIANVYALNHIHVKGKSNSLTHMTGLYISDDKIKADKHSVWNWVASACTWPAPPAAPYIANTENSGIQTLKEITNEISKEGFEVFPNPANNEVNIRLHGEDVAGTHILIYDQLGKVVWERILTEYETSLKVNFSDTKFQTGIYTVAVISSDEVMAKRLVISK